MWSTLLILALLVAVDPLRFGVTLLMISRSRPLLNLLAYWVGSMIASVPAFLVPLMVLHFAPMFTSFAKSLATPATTASSTVQHVQIGMGVLALSIAVFMTVRFSVRQRVLDPNAPTGISRLLGRAQDAETERGSAFRRLLSRALNAWEDGSLWVALVVGVASGPPPVPYLLAVTAIVASGAAIGTQVSAGIAFVIGMLAVVEIILFSYLATPAKTQAVMLRLHYWVRAHSRKIVVAIFAVLGASLVASGMGGM